MKSFVPADLAKFLQLLVLNISGQDNVDQQLTKASTLSLGYINARSQLIERLFLNHD